MHPYVTHSIISLEAGDRIMKYLQLHGSTTGEKLKLFKRGVVKLWSKKTTTESLQDVLVI